MDPLSVLRDFNTSNKLSFVQQIEGNVQFGDRYSFPAATPVYKAAFAQAASAYYSLQDVLFYLKNRNLKPQEYVMAASQSGVANINIVDRKRILDVLDGVTALDPSLVPSSAAAAAVAAGPREAAVGAEPQAKRQRLAEDEASAMRGLMEQERQLRNRNTMLLAPNKDFRRVLEVLLDVKKQVAARKQEMAAAAAVAATAGSKAGTAAPAAASGRPQDAVHGGGSSRYGREELHKASGTGGNPYGKSTGPAPVPTSGGYVPARKSGSSSSSGAPAAAASAGPAAAAVPAPPPPPPSSSSDAKATAASGVKPHGSSGGGGGSGSSKSAAAPKSAPSGRGPVAGAGGAKTDGTKRGGVPIIIVPSGMTSMINVYNAKPFLEEGKFVPASMAQAAAGGAPKPTSLTFRRTANRTQPGLEYTVTDKPPPSNSPDWDRVVAVVVQGAKWQFKDWPHKGAKDGDLVEALAKVCGFFIHFADEKVAPPVSEWNVRSVALHRENRHKDMPAMLEFYRHLDVFLQAKRSTLAY